MLVRLEAAVQQRTGAAVGSPAALFDFDDRRERAMAQLARLQNHAALVWAPLPTRTADVDSIAYASEVVSAERARYELADGLDRALREVGDLAGRPEGPSRGRPLFVLPVDDIDLNPARCLELLRLIRRYPRWYLDFQVHASRLNARQVELEDGTGWLLTQERGEVMWSLRDAPSSNLPNATEVAEVETEAAGALTLLHDMTVRNLAIGLTGPPLPVQSQINTILLASVHWRSPSGSEIDVRWQAPRWTTFAECDRFAAGWSRWSSRPENRTPERLAIGWVKLVLDGLELGAPDDDDADLLGLRARVASLTQAMRGEGEGLDARARRNRVRQGLAWLGVILCPESGVPVGVAEALVGDDFAGLLAEPDIARETDWDFGHRMCRSLDKVIEAPEMGEMEARRLRWLSHALPAVDNRQRRARPEGSDDSLTQWSTLRWRALEALDSWKAPGRNPYGRHPLNQVGGGVLCVAASDLAKLGSGVSRDELTDDLVVGVGVSEAEHDFPEPDDE